MTPLVDYHVHLDLFPKHEELLATCAASNIEVLTVTTTPRAWPKNREMAGQFKGIRVGLGLHPQVVAEREEEIGLFEKYAQEASFIGEVGLDAGAKFYRSFAAQERVFGRVLAICAKSAPKVISVHSVRCAGRVLSTIEGRCSVAEGVKIVLHWFSGSKSETARAVRMGCYFSVNATMLQTRSGMELVRSLPLERVLTETDGPFTTNVAGEPATPTSVGEVLVRLASLLRVSEEVMGAAILENMRRLESHLHGHPAQDR